MTIYFSNPGVIDLDTIRTMGVSIKDNANPIGFFGTGLKFAIATLLRNGQQVELTADGEKYVFSARMKLIRDKPFQMVYMNDEQLAFTVDLGKNWQVWQAYRELHANCMDENGRVSRTPCTGDTVFKVSGEEIEKAFDDRYKIFLHGEPSWVTDGLEIYRGKNHYLFYRGVRVYKLPKQTRFTYNFTVPMLLTEDRTLASLYDARYKLENRIPRITDAEFCRKIVDPGWDGFDSDLDVSSCWDPSEEFLDAIEEVINHAKLNGTAKELLKSVRRVSDFTSITPSEIEEKTITEALKILETLRCYPNREFIHVVEHLGAGVYATVEGKNIYLTRQSLANGIDFTAITIYEEWVHSELGFPDESRGLQQFLFDKVLELVKEIRG